MGAYIKKFLEREERRANKRRTSRNLVISLHRCYFCNAIEVIRFGEHWSFCARCSAIYTYMLLLETGCEHVKKGIPLVTNDCWFAKYRRAKTFIKYNSRGQVCSTCGEECYADGW